MFLSGKKRRELDSLDDIFGASDEFGLLNVKPRPAPPRKNDLMASRFEEINQFIDQHGRLPYEHGENLFERQMAKRLKAILEGSDHATLTTLDRHSLLAVCEPVQNFMSAEPIAPEDVMSIDDILGGDHMGLLDVGDMSILDIKHVPSEREIPDEVAQRTKCEDFWRFESVFRNLHTALKSGRAESVQFAENWQITAGDAFILNGVMCFVDEVGEEHGRGEHKDARLRLIFENGTESNMLRRSLGRALYMEETGRRILRDRDDALAESFQDIRLTHRDRRTGVVYIVKSLSNNPALAQFPHLYKIGYTELTVDERVRNAERDIAFLESPVQKVTEFECYNMNPQRFESLVHGFLAVQRLNVDLVGRDGEHYRPREWFAVSLEVAREVINRIIDGTITQYRMDNTTGQMIKKDRRLL
ncbi:GIY-YIG nuclease family protein [Pseudomonas sp. BP01]|uniref:GIY-YIG nuclease family protein n=1 Tax=unclassified Pseudomonas TaxID=196821 RepID=UPI001FAB0E0F|nr:GIY-YIG nuclease family protein [Pseudomonas sp. BP01]